MNKINGSLFALLLCATPFFAQNKEKKRDSDISDKREVSNFNAIDIELAADVFIRQADTYSFEAEGSESVLERIKTEVKDGKLYGRGGAVGCHDNVAANAVADDCGRRRDASDGVDPG